MTVTAVYSSEDLDAWLALPSDFRNAYVHWLDAHGVNGHHTYQVEHHLIDAPFIRVFQHAVNDNGRHYLDPATGDVAKRDPFDVLVTTDPPRPEDYAPRS